MSNGSNGSFLMRGRNAYAPKPPRQLSGEEDDELKARQERAIEEESRKNLSENILAKLEDTLTVREEVTITTRRGVTPFLFEFDGAFRFTGNITTREQLEQARDIMTAFLPFMPPEKPAME